VHKLLKRGRALTDKILLVDRITPSFVAEAALDNRLLQLDESCGREKIPFFRFVQQLDESGGTLLIWLLMFDRIRRTCLFSVKVIQRTAKISGGTLSTTCRIFSSYYLGRSRAVLFLEGTTHLPHENWDSKMINTMLRFA
jgi:hypothetical protein